MRICDSTYLGRLRLGLSGPSPSIIRHMKAHVYVTLKRTVLDAQGKTVADALRRMDYRGVNDVRQGKYFLLTLDNSIDSAGAQTEVERIAREVLTNPVIEEFTFRIEQ
jgi:phosphoribosylformylglycinamidine synthase subunit PurS